MFERGRKYKRKELHKQFGGQQQGGIITPRSEPVVFVITGSSGEQYGYHDDADENGVWHYYGEGTSGDMRFVRGNKAVRDHAIDGKELHLFQNVGMGWLVYVGQFICGEYEVRDDVDSNADYRKAIVFSLVPFEDLDAVDHGDPGLGSGRTHWDIPMNELREIAAQHATRAAAAPGARRNVYSRSRALRTYVLRRSGGLCEGCGSKAPFEKKDGTAYLEPHHTTRRADGGPDHPAHVIALCPNCHRRVHHGADGLEYNARLIETLGRIEGDGVPSPQPISAPA